MSHPPSRNPPLSNLITTTITNNRHNHRHQYMFRLSTTLHHHNNNLPMVFCNSSRRRLTMVDLRIDITTKSDKKLENLKEALIKRDDISESKGKFDPEKHIEVYLPVVNEKQVTSLLQCILVGFAIFTIPSIRLIPTSVLWGYLK